MCDACYTCSSEEPNLISCVSDHKICHDCFKDSINNYILKCYVCEKKYSLLSIDNEELLELFITRDKEQEIKNSLLEQELQLKKKEKESLVEKYLHTIEDILCPKCPNCSQVFYDNDACRVVGCSKCKCSFCAFCCEYYSLTSSHRDLAAGRTECHTHIKSCKPNTSRVDFVEFEIFKRDQTNYLRSKAKKYYTENVPDDIKEQIKDIKTIKELDIIIGVDNLNNKLNNLSKEDQRILREVKIINNEIIIPTHLEELENYIFNLVIDNDLFNSSDYKPDPEHNNIKTFRFQPAPQNHKIRPPMTFQAPKRPEMENLPPKIKDLKVGDKIKGLTLEEVSQCSRILKVQNPKTNYWVIVEGVIGKKVIRDVNDISEVEFMMWR